METKWYSQFLNDQTQQFEQNIFPLQVIGKGSWGIIDWLKNYEEYWKANDSTHKELDTTEFSEDEINAYNHRADYISKSLKLVADLSVILRELLRDYNVSYIELDKEISIAKVCDIFTHINSKGVPLNIFDLLNAILRPYDIYLKEIWRKVSDELDYTDPEKMKIYIFQVMSILEQTYCSSKYLYYLVPEAVKTIKENGASKKIILIKDKEEFEAKWYMAVNALIKSINTLKSPRDFGAISAKFVPYPSIIPTFTAIKKHVENTGYKNILDTRCAL